MATNVTITWKAFGNQPERKREITSASFELPNDFGNPKYGTEICDHIFQDTNLYCGFYWNLIEPVLPWNRTHTALSVGDEITIDSITYRVADVGFEKVGA